ncbi:2-keto-4-pentenoate hydratase [Phyllobacterium zundukense]|uniref:Fumarylacetoacetate hydrolase family protein n=1 Tax=Phyllobacterium zundukense TaxID=1867719 RepID=A0ACD4CXD3_9HYPH|nr:fumarylacetoacetate hydrolase family protein [Phyllobacterium zundukense]UXN58199.1 fumarylacetoacetate hydrolase family protein [Phyllobacterium zundukense]
MADNRARGRVSELPLTQILSLTEAFEIQSIAIETYSSDLDGFALAGTSESSQVSLALAQPIFAPIASNAHFGDGHRLSLAQGVLGAQCEFAFIIARPYPAHHEPITRATAAECILGCQSAIGILGRRSHHGGLNHFAAVADFGLHVATICGTLDQNANLNELDAVEVSARLDGNVVASATGSSIMGHPLEAVVWLAQELSRHGNQLSTGDIVTSGSCTPIVQVLPGQHMIADFGYLGQVSCRFE